MAELVCFSSGSQGNSYAIKCNNETLLLELGLPWKYILKGLNYDIDNIVGALVSHVHQDHANKETIKKAIQYGIPIYSCYDVVSMYKGVNEVKKGRKIAIGGFKIQAIPLFHNTTCFGFVIEHDEIGKAIFCTDTCSIPYRFKNANHLWLESNYDYGLMIDHMAENVYSQSASENHMEFNDTLEVLKENYSNDLQTIVLLHLSNGNSNANEFVKRVKETLGFNNVWVADKGLKIELCKEEF